MKRKVKALLALALTLAVVSTSLGDNLLYVSSENASEAEEQTDEPAAAAEEETEETPAAPEEAAPVPLHRRGRLFNRRVRQRRACGHASGRIHLF